VLRPTPCAEAHSMTEKLQRDVALLQVAVWADVR
jgi:hypothetical protein